MKNKNLTELVFILDRSGSMQGLEEDTIGGFNGLIEKQMKEKGDAVVTTVLFDNKYDMIYDNADIKKIPKMTRKEYYARGSTALMDAVGRTINHVKHRHKMALKSETPEHTMVVIITDGYENSSKEFDRQTIREMIERQREKHGWEFLFLGANIDAEKEAESYGISKKRAVTYLADSEGTEMNFNAVCRAASQIRNDEELTEEWKADIEERNDSKDK